CRAEGAPPVLARQGRPCRAAQALERRQARATRAAAHRSAPRPARQQPGIRTAAGAGARGDRPLRGEALTRRARLPFARHSPCGRRMDKAHFHEMPDGRRVAYRRTPGAGPALVFLPGYMSDMAGSKASALMAWAVAQGRECLLLDYSGCGESPGSFAEGTLARWSEEVRSLIASHVSGPVILVGSSMGGWLMLLAGRALGTRLAGLVGVAAAPDFTE